MNFQTFGLKEQLNSAIKQLGFENPTPIQKQAIPVALKGTDILGCANTGSGKTAAFGIPLVNQLIQDSKKSALIVAPTRELATQISKVMNTLTRNCQRGNMRAVLLIGGESMDKQKKALRGNPRILVGTPGRINDHLRAGRFQPRHFSILVLDEADRMMDMGFKPQIKDIVRELPKKRQTHLYSATFPNEIKKLAMSFQSNPQFIDVRDKSEKEGGKPSIKQTAIQLTPKQKNDKLLDELNERDGTVIVFVGTKRRTDQVAKFLGSYGHSIGLIHGGRSHGQRSRAIRDFREGKSRILVATDIAARGIDVPHVGHVINFDLPQTAEDYIHRIGRTGRAGAEGQAICFVAGYDMEMWREIMKLNVGAPKLNDPKFTKDNPNDPSLRPGVGRRGRQNTRGRNTRGRDGRGGRDTRGRDTRSRDGRGKDSRGASGGRGRDSRRTSGDRGKDSRGKKPNKFKLQRQKNKRMSAEDGSKKSGRGRFKGKNKKRNRSAGPDRQKRSRGGNSRRAKGRR